MTPLTALVLAGTRTGGDPLAAHAGVSHKALIDVGGRTMIERVVTAIAALPQVTRIVVAIEQPELLRDLPELQPSVLSKPLSTMDTAAGPSATVAMALADLGVPLLVTTADHALLQTAWLTEFLAACPANADVTAALAGRAAVEAAAPHTRRTWLRFADGDYSGCNLFLMSRPAAAGVIELWRELERHRKEPLQMMRRLGWLFALRYRFGQLSLSAATTRLGALAGGARLAIVTLRDGRSAIDVDKAADLDLVRELADR